MLSSPTTVGALSVAAAIGAFGVIYGATASTVIGPVMTIASSVLLFSGAAQFTMVALAATGAGTAAILVAVTMLALRHLPLAAVVRPRLAVGPARRALLGLVLTDESAGLAVAVRESPARTIAIVGISGYAAWLAGTLAGVLGADLLRAAPLASVVFIILFIGLSALTCRRRADVVRAVAAAGSTVALLLVVPAAGALGAVVVATAWACTGGGGRA